MREHLILDTRILAVHTLQGSENRIYKEIHVEYPGFHGLPGQFVMIKKVWSDALGLSLYAAEKDG